MSAKYGTPFSIWVIFILVIMPWVYLWNGCVSRPIGKIRQELRFMGYKNVHMLSDEEAVKLYEKNK